MRAHCRQHKFFQKISGKLKETKENLWNFLIKPQVGLLDPLNDYLLKISDVNWVLVNYFTKMAALEFGSILEIHILYNFDVSIF